MVEPSQLNDGFIHRHTTFAQRMGLFAEGERTVLRLTHRGLETFPVDNPDLARANFVEGWSAIIGTSLPEFIARRQSA